MRNWAMYTGRANSYIVSVHERHDGQWIGSMSLKPDLDPAGNSVKQEVFPTVEQALDYVGYPHSLVGIPDKLA